MTDIMSEVEGIYKEIFIKHFTDLSNYVSLEDLEANQMSSNMSPQDKKNIANMFYDFSIINPTLGYFLIYLLIRIIMDLSSEKPPTKMIEPSIENTKRIEDVVSPALKSVLKLAADATVAASHGGRFSTTASTAISAALLILCFGGLDAPPLEVLPPPADFNKDDFLIAHKELSVFLFRSLDRKVKRFESEIEKKIKDFLDSVRLDDIYGIKFSSYLDILKPYIYKFTTYNKDNRIHYNTINEIIFMLIKKIYDIKNKSKEDKLMAAYLRDEELTAASESKDARAAALERAKKAAAAKEAEKEAERQRKEAEKEAERLRKEAAAMEELTEAMTTKGFLGKLNDPGRLAIAVAEGRRLGLSGKGAELLGKAEAKLLRAGVNVTAMMRQAHQRQMREAYQRQQEERAAAGGGTIVSNIGGKRKSHKRRRTRKHRKPKSHKKRKSRSRRKHRKTRR